MLTLLLLHLRVPCRQKKKPQGDDGVMGKIAFYENYERTLEIDQEHSEEVRGPSSACRPGFYKAFAGNTKCSKCPPHSLTYVEATSVCQCEKGYFRAEKDPPSMACTSTSI
ncbi:hypothetical protein PANDA_008762 [Ailuropoda melanoleuca]|uniref:Tyrosine-protein kinase ephrin type A/B receptor-like domain-containing protein n=1 Tax=Ailuropoda melanoleuca TaxID=9646 RepID=D2HDJ0_AILME|nr:hypothetical protein PANDA_008762 [Ailuropoda melanoleuca]